MAKGAGNNQEREPIPLVALSSEREVKISKYLSKHLRHRPERLGIKLDRQGWTDIDALLVACEKHNFPVSREELEAVVTHSPKQRYTIDQEQGLIRAVQGHSVDVDLGYKKLEPPALLYHGTHEKVAGQIDQTGLSAQGRHHVHLSEDIDTARTVGSRRGRAIVFVIRALSMHHGGAAFYRADNGVWLTEVIPAAYLARLEQ